MATIKYPNGKGSITKLKGNRRNPYMVRANATYSIKDGELKESRKVIGYAKTKADAWDMLNEYFKNPYDLNKAKITFSELFNEWKLSYYLGVSKHTQVNYNTAYSHCYLIYNRVFKDLKLNDYQRMFDDAVDKNGKPLSQDCLKRTKILLGLLNNYAIKNEIITKNYSEYVDIKRYKDRQCNRINRSVFSQSELVMIWAHQNDYMAQIILTLIYTGCRIDCEFFNIKKNHVDLQNHCISIVKSKTNSGVRSIPIHDIIYPIIKNWCEDDTSEYLIHSKNGERINYSTFRKDYWTPYMKELNMTHKPHDTRHTFNSLLANLEINTDIREVLMGHKSDRVNESIYTHYKMQKLLEIVNKI